MLTSFKVTADPYFDDKQPLFYIQQHRHGRLLYVTQRLDESPIPDCHYNYAMRKWSVFLILLLVFLLITLASLPAGVVASPNVSIFSSGELVDAVNSLRASYGLPSYSPNPILMQIAQTHAEYLAAIGVSNTHIDGYGRRPYQRALDAGYPVAGQLSLGGFFAENVVGGVGLSAQGAVDIWMGDAPHQNTMLSANLQDVGAGVAIVGNTYYYVLDAGLSTGGTPVAYTPPPYISQPTLSISTSTPNPDGTITYVVRPGDTLLAIALAHKISLEEIYALNGMNERSVIYPEQTIIIRGAFTVTPTLPTSTATLRPSSTPWPTSAATILPVTPSPTATQATSNQTTNSAGGAVIAIIVAALLAAGAVTLVGARTQRKQ